VCNVGFVGDGVNLCGVSHAIGVLVSSASGNTSSALIELPLPPSASAALILSVWPDVAINGVASSVVYDVYYPDANGNKEELITRFPSFLGGSAGNSFVFEVESSAYDMRFVVTYAYSLAGQRVVDGVALETYRQCDGLDDLEVTSVGYTHAPALAQLELAWLGAAFALEFVLEAPYESDMAIVVVDTRDFDSLHDTVRQVGSFSGSCSAYDMAAHSNANANNTSATSSSSVAYPYPFYSLFASAPTATWPTALNGDHLAYAFTSGTGWQLSAVNCSSVSYRRVFTLNQLMSCHDFALDITLDPDSNSTVFSYTGSIYLHTLQPGEDTATDESQGYAKFTQQFSWELQLQSDFEALVQAAIDQERLHVVVRYLQLDGGDMVMELETQFVGTGLLDPGVSLRGTSALIVPEPSDFTSVPACPNNTASQVCMQRWLYRKPSWVDGDNQVYDFSFALYDDPSAPRLSVPILVRLHFNEIDLIVGRLGDLTLRLYDTVPDAVVGSTDVKELPYPWEAHQRIYVRGDVLVNARDIAAFNASYLELWVCVPPIAGYDITLESGGCLDPIINETARMHLIGNGQLLAVPFDPTQRLTLERAEPGATSVACAMSFLAYPLTLEPRIYTIHARVLLTPVNLTTTTTTSGRTRRHRGGTVVLESISHHRRRDTPYVPSATTNFIIMPESAESQHLPTTTWLTLMITISSVLGGTIVCLCCCICCVCLLGCCRRRRRRQQKRRRRSKKRKDQSAEQLSSAIDDDDDDNYDDDDEDDDDQQHHVENDESTGDDDDSV